MFYFTDYICGIIIKRSLPNWGTHTNIFSFRCDQTGHCPADVHWGLRDNAVRWSPLSPVPQCLPMSLDIDPLGLGGRVTACRCPLSTYCVSGISLDTMITQSLTFWTSNVQEVKNEWAQQAQASISVLKARYVHVNGCHIHINIKS